MDCKSIVIEKINDMILELDEMYDFEQGAMLIGRIKGFLEFSSLIDLLSHDELSILYDKFGKSRGNFSTRF